MRALRSLLKSAYSGPTDEVAAASTRSPFVPDGKETSSSGSDDENAAIVVCPTGQRSTRTMRTRPGSGGRRPALDMRSHSLGRQHSGMGASGGPSQGSGSDDMCSTSSAASETLTAPDDLYTDVGIMHRGRTASVFRARETNGGTPVVIKSFSKALLTPTKRQAVAHEASMLKAASGPGVVALHRQMETEDAMCLVIEACSGGTLIEAITNSGGKLSEQTVAIKVAAPLLRTLARLHSKGVVHRDLKPEHLLLAPGQGLKVADFHRAASPAIDHDPLNARVGSIEYMAPEVLDKPTAAEVFHMVLSQGLDEAELPSYTTKADVWSAGALLFESLTGHQPFLADSAADMAHVVASRLGARTPLGVPEFIALHKLSADCEDFLTLALSRDPTLRPSAAQLLLHPWIARWVGLAPGGPPLRRSREARRSAEAAARAGGGGDRADRAAGGAAPSRSSDASSEGDAPAFKRTLTHMGTGSLPGHARLRTSMTSRAL